MNVKPLKFDQLSPAAKKQWEENGTDDYRTVIQSCFNCPNWHCERVIDHSYAYNPCLVTQARGDGDFATVKFDFWCPDYAGSAGVPNLVWREEWDAIKDATEVIDSEEVVA